MGEVFAAENIRTGRPVAVKLLRADSKTKSSAVARFRQEALPKMAEAIVELDKLSDEAGRTIENMDNARKIAGVINTQLGQS
jgi:serine/threonine protein kinase